VLGHLFGIGAWSLNLRRPGGDTDKDVCATKEI
jgi:hypothetical protein